MTRNADIATQRSLWEAQASPTLTLFELNGLVRRVLERSLGQEYWVEAELSECRESRGHCYMELIQKEPGTATPVARASAKCWRSQWSLLQPYFERTAGLPLHAGLKVRLKVYAQFHEAYGFSWIVTDVDPAFTLGDMARRRMEIVNQLKQEGVFDLQKELPLPLFCQHVAVISSQTAAGYGDFCKQLDENPYGFKFRTQLFPAIMQGEGTEQSIIEALDHIYAACTQPAEGAVAGGAAMPFDCVVIIRGGGATADLSGFDTLALAENVAQFPLPVITGIGHDRDESVLDMVSHTRVKTPTAAADLLIAHLKAILDTLQEAQATLTHRAQQKLAAEHFRLAAVAEAIPRLFSVVRTRQEARLDALHARLQSHTQHVLAARRAQLDVFAQRLPLLASRRLADERHRIELAEEKTKALDPQLLLKRGYSITLKDGHAVRDPQALRPGDEIETRVEKGTIKSIIQ